MKILLPWALFFAFTFSLHANTADASEYIIVIIAKDNTGQTIGSMKYARTKLQWNAYGKAEATDIVKEKFENMASIVVRPVKPGYCYIYYTKTNKKGFKKSYFTKSKNPKIIQRDRARITKNSKNRIEYDGCNTSTALAGEQDKRTQRQNESRLRAEYKKKKGGNQQSTKPQQQVVSSTLWNCETQWRADKCGDRHTVHNINRLNNAYTPGGPLANSNASSSATEGANPANGETKDNHSSSSDNNDGSQNQIKLGPRRLEALAICRPKKNNLDLWWCDGPIQQTILADDPLKVQLAAVGCKMADPTNQRLALDDRHYVFFCKYGQQDHDRDIARIHGLPGHILVKRKAYQCNKTSLARCQKRVP